MPATEVFLNFYYLQTHTAAYAETQKEFDAVVGSNAIAANHLCTYMRSSASRYVTRCLSPPSCVYINRL
jgi:hypothetical protein